VFQDDFGKYGLVAGAPSANTASCCKSAGICGAKQRVEQFQIGVDLIAARAPAMAQPHGRVVNFPAAVGYGLAGLPRISVLPAPSNSSARETFDFLIFSGERFVSSRPENPATAPKAENCQSSTWPSCSCVIDSNKRGQRPGSLPSAAARSSKVGNQILVESGVWGRSQGCRQHALDVAFVDRAHQGREQKSIAAVGYQHFPNRPRPEQHPSIPPGYMPLAAGRADRRTSCVRFQDRTLQFVREFSGQHFYQFDGVPANPGMLVGEGLNHNSFRNRRQNRQASPEECSRQKSVLKLLDTCSTRSGYRRLVPSRD